MIHPIQIDIIKLRIDRQSATNSQLVEALKSGDTARIRCFANEKEPERYLREQNLSFDIIVEKCKSDEIYANLLATYIAKNSTKQCDLDETEQIRVCNETASKFGIYVNKLKKDEYRPMKTEGRIVDKETCKAQKINIESQCFKSFDGRITGKKEGWMFLKAVIGSGGHQSSVFREADEMCSWAKDNKGTWVAVVIDTDQHVKLSNLKKRYSEVDVFIGSSYEFQQYIIDLPIHE